jgi:hypothetical protein
VVCHLGFKRLKHPLPVAPGTYSAATILSTEWIYTTQYHLGPGRWARPWGLEAGGGGAQQGAGHQGMGMSFQLSGLGLALSD